MNQLSQLGILSRLARMIIQIWQKAPSRHLWKEYWIYLWPWLVQSYLLLRLSSSISFCLKEAPSWVTSSKLNARDWLLLKSPSARLTTWCWMDRTWQNVKKSRSEWWPSLTHTVTMMKMIWLLLNMIMCSLFDI